MSISFMIASLLPYATYVSLGKTEVLRFVTCCCCQWYTM